TVPADGTVPYLYFSMPTNFTEDKWIQAMEIRPGNRTVVHHVIAYAQDPKVKDTSAGGEGDLRRGRVHLGGITPNKTGVVFSPGTARMIPKGSNIVFQMHYTTNGQVGKDRTKIGFVFAKQPGQKMVQTGNAVNNRFVIPAGNDNHEVKASFTFKDDVEISSFMPHMHVRGKAFTYTAVYPDGRSEILLNVPKYDFNWQLTYLPKNRLVLPKGTRLDCVAYFDNSTKNKYNPDPTKDVRWGDQTWEEMMIGWYTYSVVKSPQPQASSSSTGQ
ncbi:MAG: thiol-disulfide isomerase, partial [Blastocatellia bacterium]